MSIPRRLALLVTALALCLAPLLPAHAQGVTVTLDGRVLSFDQPPMEVGGRVLVPLRGIFESLGANVSYNASSRSITATRGATTVQLTLGSRQAFVNGSPVGLDVPAQEVGGRTMVPLRFISESLGADVRWNSATRSVSMTSPATVGVTPPVTPPSPPFTPVVQAPQITGIVVNASRELHPGDRLRVSMTGTPGCTASFDIAGLQTGIDMRETNPGQYRGTVTIDNSMLSAGHLRVVGRLRNASGLEDMEQADQVVAVTPQGGPVVGPAPGGPFPGTQGGISIAPGGPFYAGQTVTISANGAPGAYATMSVGNTHNIPMQQTAPGTYIGTYTLSAGDTTPMPVTVTFRLPTGEVTSLTSPQPLGIGLGGYPTSGGPYPYPGALFLNVTSPAPGQHITGDFMLRGNTVPFATVQVQGTVQRPLIPGVIGIPTERVTASGRADGNGNFAIPVQLGRVPDRGSISLQAQAIDPAGRTSQWMQFQYATGP